MPDATYRQAFEEALAALEVQPTWEGRLTERARATATGRREARAYADDPRGRSPAEALGAPWTEMGKGYPRRIGILLSAQGIDPDVDEARELFAKGFREELEKVAGKALDGIAADLARDYLEEASDDAGEPAPTGHGI